MSRQYNIRWTQDDNEKLKKAVKNFNAKIKRLENKYPENKNALPERTSVKQMKELIETRTDLKRELNSLKRFTKRGAEEIVSVPNNDYNLQITKWQKNEMTRRVSIINRKRKRRLEEIQETPIMYKGEELGYKKGDIGMGKAEEVSLKPMTPFTRKMTRKDLIYKYKHIISESQASYWNKREIAHKQQYIESLEQNYNPNDIKDVVEKIDKMDYKEFRKIFDSDGGSFEYSYPPNKKEYAKYLEHLRSVWTPNKKGK